MILNGDQIRDRCDDASSPPEIFKPDTWVDSGFMEASYVLRVATDQVMIDGTFYEKENHYPGTFLEIKPGRIAVLSTMEELIMPNDLVGKIGIRIRYALKGLTGRLMGIQVDPCYGQQRDGERLYIRVANLGNETIKLLPKAPVFTFEVHQLAEPIDCTRFPKEPTWEVLKGGLSDQDDASWSYATRINDDSEERARRLEEQADEREERHQNRFEVEISRIRDYIQPVVMFGIFLVAVTILGVSIATIVSLRNVDGAAVPTWLTEWGWALLLITLVGAVLATSAVAVLTCVQLVLSIKRKPKEGRANQGTR
ncbi:MAG: hypothetical protein F4X83_09895 [Chloroflexi bacterium]|nr:hypothetical protein [Chloroflexota bacterium]